MWGASSPAARGKGAVRPMKLLSEQEKAVSAPVVLAVSSSAGTKQKPLVGYVSRLRETSSVPPVSEARTHARCSTPEG